MKGGAHRRQAAWLAAGLALAACLVYAVGVENVVRSARLVGPGILVIVAAAGLRHLLRATAWMQCFGGGGQGPGLRELFHVRLAGEALRYVTPTGPFLSEPAKAALLRRHLPPARAFSAAAAEWLTYALSASVVAAGGLALLLLGGTGGGAWAAAAAVVTAAGLLAAVRREVSRRSHPLSRLVSALGARTGRGWLLSRVEGVRRVESSLYDFYGGRRDVLLLVLLLEAGTHMIGVVNIYFALHFLGLDPTWPAAFISDAAPKALNSVFFFVPGQAGVHEGGRALLLEALGHGMAAGVALALVERVSTAAWAAYGLVVLCLRVRGATC